MTTSVHLKKSIRLGLWINRPLQSKQVRSAGVERGQCCMLFRRPARMAEAKNETVYLPTGSEATRRSTRERRVLENGILSNDPQPKPFRLEA